MFKRILKTVTALGAGHGVQTLTQLLTPPVFIGAYGVTGYGEWLVLSAAVGYLSTLDFGLQTYVLNELTALYHRQEMEQFHRVQSVGLILMLCFVGAGALAALGALLVPVASLLKMAAVHGNPAWTIFWLALQVLVSIPLGQLFGIYRTFGQTHRGVMWGNFHRLSLLALTVSLAFLKVPFWVIAFGQFLASVLFVLALLIWLKHNQPEVCPRLDYWNKTLAGQILKPSAFFGFFILNNFLVYQAPVLLLQRFLGPEVVVAFSVARMLFSFVRQGAALAQQAIYPEVTRLNGIGEKTKLARLYVLFEAVMLTTVLIINSGLLLLSPTLLWLWLKRPQLFDLRVFIPVMLVSIFSSVKEYKLYFQYATNNHAQTGLMTFLSYAVMILASIPAIPRFGVTGFLGLWLAVELLQIGFVHYCNTRLFAAQRPEISLQPAFRLGLVLAMVVALMVSAHSFLQTRNYLWQGLAAFLVMSLLAGVSYFAFDIRLLIQEGKGQLAKVRFG
jgi:O-antigen/teichoic acid export membrane protein